VEKKLLRLRLAVYGRGVNRRKIIILSGNHRFRLRYTRGGGEKEGLLKVTANRRLLTPERGTKAEARRIY